MERRHRPLVLVLLLFIVSISQTNAQNGTLMEDTSTNEALNSTESDSTTAAPDTRTKEDESCATDTSADGFDGRNTTDLADKTTLDTNAKEEKKDDPVQVGPFIDLFGDNLLSLELVDETHAKMELQYTNEALHGKKVIGIYFSADWCGPCRQFTPELVSFYKKMNERRKKENEFEIVWVSSCRDIESFGQYFTHMSWLALPPEEAMGQRGKELAKKYKVKGIPHLALLDEVGNVITLQGRTKVPEDRTGIGFPWRNPLSTLYVTFVPQSLRFILRTQLEEFSGKLSKALKGTTQQTVNA